MGWRVSLADFVQQQQQPAQQARLARLPHMELPVSRALLYGPERSGKTSLLFQFAFQLAAKAQGEVVILCDQAGLDQAPPLLPAGVDASHEALARIHFKYVNDLQQLKAYGACLHLLQQPPAAIIVDGLSSLARNSRLPDRRSQDVALTKALAFLADALDHMREQRDLDVLLLACDSAGRDGALPHMYLLQRWFPLMLAVTGTPEAGQLLTLQVAAPSRPAVSTQAARAAVHYTLTRSYVHVESVQEG